MKRVPMTIEGAEKLRKELNFLKSTERPRIVNSIAEARAHGDLKENAEYHAAREQQSFVEGRIQEIEGKLSDCEIIDISKVPHTGKVLFGTTVELFNIDTDETVAYQIVGEDEADIKAFKISVSSPIARGLVGKAEGDEVSIQTPGGVVHYEVVAVRHV